MELTVLQENLQKALSFVGKGISTKTQIPILSNILLEAKGGRLTLSSTNLETTTSFWIGASVIKEGSLTVPARFFQEVISSLSQDKVFLKEENMTLRLVCGESEVTLAGISAQEFPPLPVIGETPTLTIHKSLFENDLSLISVAASSDESRPLLTGIKFVKKDGGVELVATDGYRLALKKNSSLAGIAQEFVLSARTLVEVGKMVSEEKNDTVGVFFDEKHNQVTFALPHIHTSARLIEGDYPLYEKIIPKNHTTSVVFNREELLKAVKLASVYAKESANIIKLKVESGKVTVSANSPQIGENKTTLSVTVEGEGGEIAFNSRFLLDLLGIVKEEELILEMGGALAPGVFRLPKDESYLHIIMPVRVQG